MFFGALSMSSLNIALHPSRDRSRRYRSKKLEIRAWAVLLRRHGERLQKIWDVLSVMKYSNVSILEEVICIDGLNDRDVGKLLKLDGIVHIYKDEPHRNFRGGRGGWLHDGLIFLD